MEYFILGILTALLFIPVIEGFCSLCLTIIETIKGYFSVKIAKYNQQLLKAREDSEIKPINQIGFTFEEDEDQEEEYDD